MAPLGGMSGGDIETVQRADYTLRIRWGRNVDELVRGFGGEGAGSGADEEPFGGAADAAPGGAAFGNAHGIVAFFGEGGGLFLFVGEIALDGGELGLAGFAVDGEVVERLQVFSGDNGVGLWTMENLELRAGIAERLGMAGGVGWGARG